MFLSRECTLPRRHVTKALVDAVIQHPLTVLAAPMGYGKSLAARALVDELSSYPDWRIFLQSVPGQPFNSRQIWCQLAEQLMSQGSKAGAFMRRIAFPPNTDALHHIARFGRQRLTYINELARRAGVVSVTPQRSPVALFASSMPQPLIRTLLIIDDWRSTDDKALDQILEALVREELPGLSIVLLSREWPEFNLEELCLKNLAIAFDHTLLAFSEAEIVALFRLNGIEDTAAAKDAWQRTQGWPTAACLRARGDLPKEHGTAALPDMDTLLAQTCFDPLPDADKVLMLRLCVLEAFTPEQAFRLTHEPDIPARLTDLSRRITFMFRGTGGEYRLHPLLREFFEKRLTLDGKTFNFSRAEIVRQAGEMYLAEGDTVKAIHAFAKAGRNEDLERILEIPNIPVANYSLVLDPLGIAERLIALPWSVRKAHPLAYLAFIYEYVSWVDTDKGSALLDEAEKAFTSDSSMEPELAAHIAGEINLIRCFLHRGDMPRQIDLLRQARELLRGPSAVIPAGHVCLAGSPHGGLLHHCTPGTYETMVRTCERHMTEFLQITHGYATGVDLLIRAELLLEAGRFDEVTPMAIQADHEARRGRQLSVRVAVGLVRARMALITGGDENLLSPLTDLLPEVRAASHPMHQVSMDLAMGYILATMGKTRQIAPWLRQGDFDPNRMRSQGMGMAYIVHGKYLLAQGRYRQLADFCSLMLRQFAHTRSVFGLTHAHCQMASATLHLYGPDAATPHLMAAGELARPDGLILPLACYGSFLLPVMERLYETSSRKDRNWPNTLATVAARIARKIPIYGKSRCRPQHCSPPMQSAISALSVKSRRVLSLVAQGRSNAEVAHALGVKPVTVAKTLGIIYRSLDVRNRAEAIAVWTRYEEGLETG